jgi:hypothetical protein
MVRLFLIGVTFKTFLVATVRDSENTETSKMDWRTSCSNIVEVTEVIVGLRIMKEKVRRLSA